MMMIAAAVDGRHHRSLPHAAHDRTLASASSAVGSQPSSTCRQMGVPEMEA